MRNAGVHLVEAVVDLLNFAAPLVRQADGKIAVFRPAHFLRESCDRLYDDAVGQKDGQRDEQDCVEHIPDEQLLKAAGNGAAGLLIGAHDHAEAGIRRGPHPAVDGLPLMLDAGPAVCRERVKLRADGLYQRLIGRVGRQDRAVCVEQEAAHCLIGVRFCEDIGDALRGKIDREHSAGHQPVRADERRIVLQRSREHPAVRAVLPGKICEPAGIGDVRGLIVGGGGI